MRQLIDIKYRKRKLVKLDELSNVNVLIGDANAGKTLILKGIEETIKNSVYVDVNKYEDYLEELLDSPAREEFIKLYREMCIEDNKEDPCFSLYEKGGVFKRYFSIIANIMLGKEVILIDDIMDNLTKEILKKSIHYMYTLGIDSQFFIATHSYDLLTAIPTIEKNTISVYKVFKDNMKIKTAKFQTNRELGNHMYFNYA